MARREPSPLLGVSKPGDLADVARRDLMVANGARQLGSLEQLHQLAAVRDAEAQRAGSMSPV